MKKVLSFMALSKMGCLALFFFFPAAAASSSSSSSLASLRPSSAPSELASSVLSLLLSEDMFWC
jgi:hypothetical protein